MSMSPWDMVHVWKSKFRSRGAGGHAIAHHRCLAVEFDCQMEDPPWNGMQTMEAMDHRISSKPHKYVLSITSMCTLSVYAHDAILVSTSLKNCDDQFQYLMHETPKIISKEAFYYIMDQNKNKKMKTETEKPLCASKRYKNAKNFFFTMKLIILWMNTRSLNGMGHSTFNPKQEQTINKVHVHPRTT